MKVDLNFDFHLPKSFLAIHSGLGLNYFKYSRNFKTFISLLVVPDNSIKSGRITLWGTWPLKNNC